MDGKIIRTLIKDIEKYEAHITRESDGTVVNREKLETHICLTTEYFTYIWREKGLSEMLERFQRQLCPEMTEEAKVFLQEMIWGIPVFHDFGKINPEFQNRKMQNENVKKSKEFACVSGRHSIISAIAYMDYFLEEMKGAVKSRTDKKFLRMLLVYHAYIIAKHHSDLDEFEKFLGSVEYGEGKSVLEVFQSDGCSAYLRTFTLNEGKTRDIFQSIRKASAASGPVENSIAMYGYIKMLYSSLVASDYYATAEFSSGRKITELGDLNEREIKEWVAVYENTELMKKIRKYQREEYPKNPELLVKEKNINHLRTEMLLDAEKVLKSKEGETIFYLEAPTGSGKSNTAMNISFQLMKMDSRLKKIYYIYPFNTLVEQNVDGLRRIFGNTPEIFDKIAVINSLTPIKMTEKEKQVEEETEQSGYYQKALLDRQFLNYPLIVSTHVSLFDTLFGDTKESVFGFHQLMNSVVVLDEIQSYKNLLWGEIIHFLKELSYLLNMKIVIMSATLPDLDLLSDYTDPAVRLITDREKYFLHPCFKDRVKVSFELMEPIAEKGLFWEKLIDHMRKYVIQNKKILVEFIKKTSAYSFYERLRQEDISCEVEYMSGDDSLAERSRILEKIKGNNQAIILVATQVIEAGVDIDMDIGYKNVSKLDSEEQFLGRINRSCLREGIVYFFKLDDGKNIYGEDIRLEREFTLENLQMQELLQQKDFRTYYENVLDVLKRNYNEQVDEHGINHFFHEVVGRQNYPEVKRRMQLIGEDTWSMSVYLARTLQDENGEYIDGKEIWQDYAFLLNDFQMDYAEKKVKLSAVKSKMNYFIYQIRKNPDLIYNDRIGEIFYIEEGQKYFDNGKLNRQKLQGEIGEFVDFI